MVSGHSYFTSKISLLWHNYIYSLFNLKKIYTWIHKSMWSNTTPLYHLCQSNWLSGYKLPRWLLTSYTFQMLLWDPIFYSCVPSLSQHTNPNHWSELHHSLATLTIRTCSDLPLLTRLDFRLVVQMYSGLVIRAWQTQGSSIPGNFHYDQSGSAGSGSATNGTRLKTLNYNKTSTRSSVVI